MKQNVVSLIGHRDCVATERLKALLFEVLSNLIEKESATIFLFGSRSKFNDLALLIVTDLKEKYSFLKRIYVRAEYEYISWEYTNFLLKSYDETYFSEKSHNAGRLNYVTRNREIIDKSDICIFYYNEKYEQSIKCYPKKSSGTKLAYEYAVKKHKKIINVFS